jgi:hypothetical protein
VYLQKWGEKKEVKRSGRGDERLTKRFPGRRFRTHVLSVVSKWIIAVRETNKRRETGCQPWMSDTQAYALSALIFPNRLISIGSNEIPGTQRKTKTDFEVTRGRHVDICGLQISMNNVDGMKIA